MKERKFIKFLEKSKKQKEGGEEKPVGFKIFGKKNTEKGGKGENIKKQFASKIKDVLKKTPKTIEDKSPQMKYYISYISKNSETRNKFRKISSITKLIKQNNLEIDSGIKKEDRLINKVGFNKKNLIDLLYVLFAKIKLQNNEKIISKKNLEILLLNPEGKKIIFNDVLNLENADNKKIEERVEKACKIIENLNDVISKKEELIDSLYGSEQYSFIFKEEENKKSEEKPIKLSLASEEDKKEEKGGNEAIKEILLDTAIIEKWEKEIKEEIENKSTKDIESKKDEDIFGSGDLDGIEKNDKKEEVDDIFGSDDLKDL